MSCTTVTCTWGPDVVAAERAVDTVTIRKMMIVTTKVQAAAVVEAVANGEQVHSGH